MFMTLYFENNIVDNRVNLCFENLEGSDLLLSDVAMVHLIYSVELRLHKMKSNYYEVKNVKM